MRPLFFFSLSPSFPSPPSCPKRSATGSAGNLPRPPARPESLGRVRPERFRNRAVFRRRTEIFHLSLAVCRRHRRHGGLFRSSAGRRETRPADGARVQTDTDDYVAAGNYLFHFIGYKIHGDELSHVVATVPNYEFSPAAHPAEISPRRSPNQL